MNINCEHLNGLMDKYNNTSYSLTLFTPLRKVI